MSGEEQMLSEAEFMDIEDDINGFKIEKTKPKRINTQLRISTQFTPTLSGKKLAEHNEYVLLHNLPF